MGEGGDKYILAIDLGTSGPKSALVTMAGEVVDYAFEENEVILLPGGGAEQRPDEWWQTIIRTARRVLEKGLVPNEDIAAVCCSTQWSGTVPVDRDGTPVANAIIWLDSRGSKYVKDIAGGPVSIQGYAPFKLMKWLRLTGGIPSHSGKDPIAHILLLKNERPDIYARTYKFLEPKDYINLKLTGKFAASFDSIAIHWVTDNRDLARVDYSEPLLRMAGVEREKFPDLRRAVDILGPIRKEVADELGLREDVQVVMGTPDVQAAALGSGAVRDFEGHLYIGTSSWLTCHVPYKKTDIFHNMATLPSAIPERYFIANEQETAGGCLNFLRDNILYHKDQLLQEEKQPDVYKVFDRIAEGVPPGSGKVIFTPWLYGERTPVEDHAVRSGIFNQSLNTTREHMIRAVLEGVAFNGRWLLGYVEKFIRRPLNPINMIGGGANSPIWCQIHADVFNRTIRQVKDPILANLRGAAFLAAVSLGYCRFEDIPDRVRIANTYLPNPDNRGIYDELFAEFKNIYKCNRRIYARLNRSS
jgi:xylulokinase